MNNYPNGISHKDFNKPTFEYKQIEVIIEDLEIDNGQGLQACSLWASVEQLTDGSLNIESAYYELMGNNGEIINNAEYVIGSNEKHEQLIYEKAAKRFERGT